MIMPSKYGSWRYMLSSTLDFCIFCGLVFLFMFLYAGTLDLIKSAVGTLSSSINNPVIAALILILWFFYFFVPVRISGRTIGLRSFSLKIVSPNNGSLSTWEAINWAVLLAIPVAVLFDILHALVFPNRTFIETRTNTQIVQIGRSK